MTYKEFWKLHNGTHCTGVTLARSQGLQELPEEFNEVIRKCQVAMLEKLILDAKLAYYKTGEPIMDDCVYDKAEECLRSIEPNSMVLSKVGYEMEKTDEK